jgi:hypothetical protein
MTQQATPMQLLSFEDWQAMPATEQYQLYRNVSIFLLDEMEDKTQSDQDSHKWQDRYIELEARHTEQSTRFGTLLDWMADLLANSTIPVKCKLVSLHFYLVFWLSRWNIANEEKRIGIQDTADALGYSVSTIEDAIKKLEMWEIIKTRHEDYTTEDGEKRSLVHVTNNDVFEHPRHIVMENRHGGQREPRCPKCGSTNVDRYTVQNCRDCNTNAWYGQPGLRADADVTRAHHGINSPLYKKGMSGIGQDAQNNKFPSPIVESTDTAIASATTIAQHAAEHQANYTEQQKRQLAAAAAKAVQRQQAQTAPSDISGINQDAFANEASSPVIVESADPATATQLAAEHTLILTTASCQIIPISSLLRPYASCSQCGPQGWHWSPLYQQHCCNRCNKPPTVGR